METIYKYKLVPAETQAIIMPEGAKVLTVQVQRGCPCLWALVESTNPPIARHFRIYGTGENFVHGEYIGSFQLAGGDLVFHVFE